MTFQHAIGWTLLHFLWQATLITLAFGLVNLAARNAGARLRYGLACGAMLLLLACPIFSLALLMQRDGAISEAVSVEAVPASAVVMRLVSTPERIPDYLALVVYVWIAGVAAFATRLVVQWRDLRSVRRQATVPEDSTWQRRLHVLATRLGIQRLVELRESAIAAVPAVMGAVKPVILIPAGALARLTPEEMEALLAHELAHVLRHDYLVNLLQTAIETLFFYHPGVWWISRRMREERENCCDDIAVRTCGDAIRYVRALAEMEGLRAPVPGLAMAATGGSLLRRAQRLLAPDTQNRGAAPSGATVAALAVLTLVFWAAPQAQSKAGVDGDPAPEPQAEATPAPRPQPTVARANTQTSPTGESYLDRIEQAGFRGLTVDQLIAMKIHGVTPEYIRAIRNAGYIPTSDQLVSMKIHGVDGPYIDQWKQAGLSTVTIDQLVALKIHDAQPEDCRKWRSLGYRDLNAEHIVRLRIAGVTPDFAETAKKRGLGNLDIDKLIQLKRMGILDRDPN